MSATTKKYIIRDYMSRFGEAQDALVLSVRGVPAGDNNRMRLALGQKDIRITVVRNNLARHALKETPIGPLCDLFQGPTALAYGGTSVVDVAREVMKWAEQLQQLELRGAILDGEVFSGKEGVRRLSSFPTRVEAQAKVVTLVLSPAQKVVGAAKGPGSKVLGIVKTIEEKLEKGESIAKIG